MHRESFVQVSCFVLLSSNTHSNENKHTVPLTRCQELRSSPVCRVLLLCIPLGISKVHEKSVQISCSFWNFPGIDALSTACVTCCMWERDLGFLLYRGFLLPVIILLSWLWSDGAGLGLLRTAAWTWFLLAEHAASPFPLYFFWAEDHYNSNPLWEKKKNLVQSVVGSTVCCNGVCPCFTS